LSSDIRPSAPALADTRPGSSALRSSDPADSDEVTELDDLYEAFSKEQLAPLWTQVGELMPGQPAPSARPHVWRWRTILDLAEQAGQLVPVDRGGERRAIALANPGLGGLPYATPTLWAAIQYLAPGETAPEHRHTQNAFRFVAEGQGVWTVVDGDPVSMQRGDLLLTPGWHFHGHQNVADSPMAWLDGLDIPFVQQTDSGFLRLRPRHADRHQHARPIPRRAAVGSSWPAARRTAGCAAELTDRGVPVAVHRPGSCRAAGDRR